MKSKRVRNFITRYKKNNNKKGGFGSGQENYTDSEWNSMSLADKSKVLTMRETGGVKKLKGGVGKNIQGTDAIEYLGRTHDQGGILVDAKTEVENKETEDGVTFKDGKQKRYFFSSHLKTEEGMPFSARHKQLLSMNAPQSEIDILAKLQEEKAGRTSKDIVKTGGIRKLENGGSDVPLLSPKLMAQMKQLQISQIMKIQNVNKEKATKLWEEQQAKIGNVDQGSISATKSDEERGVISHEGLTTGQDTWVEYLNAPSTLQESQDRVTMLQEILEKYQNWEQTTTHSGDQRILSPRRKSTKEEREFDAKVIRYNKQQIKLINAELKKQTVHFDNLTTSTKKKEKETQKLIEEENKINVSETTDEGGGGGGGGSNRSRSRNRSNIPAVSYFTNKEDGNIFRKWMNENYPEYSSDIDLDEEGDYDNSYINKAYKEYGTEYQTHLTKQKDNYNIESPEKGTYTDEEGNLYERGTTGKWRVRYNKATAEGIPEFGEMQFDYEDDWTDIESESDINLDALTKYTGDTPEVKIKDELKEKSSQLDDTELPDKSYWDQTKLTQLAQLIPAWAAFKEKPDYMDTQQINRTWSPVIPERIAKTHLDRIDMNADRARNTSDYRSMNKFIDSSGLGPAAMANRMAAYSRKQQGDREITAKETQVNTTIMNQEATMNQQAAAASAPLLNSSL